jgi:trehalose synthase-fused probable maltokinase
MSELAVPLEDGAIGEAELIEFVTAQRWFGSKAREVAHASVVDVAELRSQRPYLYDALVEIRFQPGTHETYQVLVGARDEGDEWGDGVIATAGGLTFYDALADPLLARELVHRMRAGDSQPAREGTIEFANARGFAGLGTELLVVRPFGGEQSNSSVVFDDELILKAFRRLEAGINPELELLRFLTEREFPNIAALGGWYAYGGRPMDATLGILQRYVGGRDGWELALDELDDAPERFLGRLRRLGEVTGELHSVLGSDHGDPNFCPEETSTESLGLLTATIDEEISQVFLDLPEDSPELEPILGRGEEVRERLRTMTYIGGAGRIIRHHGDFHLGQTLWANGDWVILDFEGEPARSLPERRRKRSPLRDVAGMLRSFAYAVSAARIDRGVEAPPGWEERARAEFLAAYLETVDSSLIPAGAAVERLLQVFELEKAVYELRYELNNRPDWVSIPVAGIVRLLEEPAEPS